MRNTDDPDAVDARGDEAFDPTSVEDLARRWPAVAPIHRRLVRPLDVAVRGAAGSGRRTLVTAIQSATSASAVIDEPHCTVPDVDVVLYLLVDRVRAGDRESIARLPADRRIVLLNKADCCGPSRSADVARRCADDLGVRVTPTSGLWATTTVTSDDAALLRELAWYDDPLPALTAQFAAADPARAGLLRRVGRQGIVECLDAVRAGRVAGNPADFTTLLRRRCGLRDLAAQLRSAGPAVRDFRRERARGELNALAAAAPGQLRDAAEQTLMGAAHA
ncbi:hypothetical protein HH308_14695 [Gordonia sp. TBRC 11910]|uniref:Uncharacterized protein n=1 Tax=Gordonia asplenii TaxID=2725283 RepID=A0A848L067_9ACTN|nr:hypothetical protein [Gordonia asplenii]NMO02465.1 hypothetical protein [Gordonia asplenii]